MRRPSGFTLPAPGPGPLDEAFVDAAAADASDLPAPLRTAVRAFAADSGPDGTLLLRGLPIGTVPATPLDPKSVPDKDRASELTLLAVARLLGEPIGYVQEHGGGIVQNIVPAPETEGRQVSTSSNVTLAWHTETAFHPHKPRYLLLLCLRGDAAAATLAVLGRALPPAPRRRDDRDPAPAAVPHPARRIVPRTGCRRCARPADGDPRRRR